MSAPPAPGPPPAPGSRDARRRRSEEAILGAARELFAELGFERTTIRGVAAAAGVDPALVMQHHGNKEALFAAAARWPDEAQEVLRAAPEELPAAALGDFFLHFEDSETRDATLALMRNCLTHPSAQQVMRDEVMCERQAAVAAAMEGPDAELRAALFGACMMGLGMARHVLQVEPVASASREDVERLFLPVLQALVHPPDGR